MLDKNLLAKIQSLYIKSRRLATMSFTGEFKSAFRGQGMEFEEFREYVPGDDVRSIDWNVTARFNKPFIKIYKEEREQCVMLVIDVSQSQYFGSSKQTKKEYTAEIASLIAYSASQSQDKIGLLLFSDQVESYIPPKKGMSHVWHIIRQIMTHKPSGKKTNISLALKHLGEVNKKSAVTFLFSDFLDNNYQDVLKSTSIRHDIIPLVIRDSQECKFSVNHLIELSDLETGQVYFVDMSQKRNRQLFEEQNMVKSRVIKRDFEEAGLDSVFLTVGEDYIKPLIKLFRVRERKS